MTITALCEELREPGMAMEGPVGLHGCHVEPEHFPVRPAGGLEVWDPHEDEWVRIGLESCDDCEQVHNTVLDSCVVDIVVRVPLCGWTHSECAWPQPARVGNPTP